jgi:hypothetical protein
MILRQPVPQRRRQQKRLLTITIPEILAHPDIQLNPPDDPDLRDSLATKQKRSESTWLPVGHRRCAGTGGACRGTVALLQLVPCDTAQPRFRRLLLHAGGVCKPPAGGKQSDRRQPIDVRAGQPSRS